MKNTILTAFTFALIACNGNKPKQDAETFLKDYNKKYQELLTASNEAQWNSNVKIVKGDSTNAIAVRKTGEAFAQYTGSKTIIEKAQELLKNKNELTPLQVRELQKILYIASGNPEVAG